VDNVDDLLHDFYRVTPSLAEKARPSAAGSLENWRWDRPHRPPPFSGKESYPSRVLLHSPGIGDDEPPSPQCGSLSTPAELAVRPQ
jgi:hypothetical protein